MALVESLRRHRWVVLIGCLLAVALLIRLQGISRPSIEQRETNSALLSREWYLDDGTNLPRWKQRVLHALRGSVKPIEPPVIDRLAAYEFRLSGENFWFARLLSSLFWVVGGIFVYLIATRLTTGVGAMVALALYLTWPFGVWHSRKAMPDAEMVCLLLAAVLAVIRYWERRSRGRFVAAAALAAIATAAKPGIAFLFLAALFVALAVSRGRLLDSVRHGELPLFLLLASSLAVAYYVYGTQFSNFIWPAASAGRITPGVLLQAWPWRDLWDAVSLLLRFPQPQKWLAVVPLAAGLSGIVIAPRGAPRAVLVGLLVGYGAFAVTFINYTSGNPYYSLPLIPILSLGIGVLAGAAYERAKVSGAAARVAVLALFAATIVVAVAKSHAVLIESDPRQRIADFRRIGETTGHTTRALIVNDQLRTPVMYWGWVVGDTWEFPEQDPPPSARRMDYLIVDGLDRFGNAPGVRRFTRGLPIVSKTSRYAIYDLRARYGRR